VLGLVAVGVAIRFPAWRPRVIYAIPTTLITWQASDALKNVFRRPRPDYWRLIHEPTFSYSSGHAMFAVLVFWLWGWFIWNSDLPRSVRVVVAPLFALWGCGVIWSRLALGAHYVTDLIGGVLLAVTALGVASAIASVVRRNAPAVRA
jgi:undecaprenyl-diphosphatase